ncbi:Lrp/AsnC ligand binding domain-containing protein [Bradyrhizobium sp. UFLA05-109]
MRKCWRFGQLLADFPEVIEAYLTAGDCDYLVKVASKAPRATSASCVKRHPLQQVVIHTSARGWTAFCTNATPR